MKNITTSLLLAICAASILSAQTPAGCAPEPIIYRVNGAKLRVTTADLSLDTANATLANVDGITAARSVSLTRPATGAAVISETAFDDLPTGDYLITLSAKLPGCNAVGLSRPVQVRVPATTKNLWATLQADDSGIYVVYPTNGVVAAGNGTALFQNVEQDSSISLPFLLEGSYWDELFKPTDLESYGLVSATAVPLKLVPGGQVVNVVTSPVQFYFNPADFGSSSALYSKALPKVRAAVKAKVRYARPGQLSKDEGVDIVE